MKNIEQILQEIGVELTDDQKKTLNKEVNENYRTINDYNNQKQKLETAEKSAKDNEKAYSDFMAELEKLEVKDVEGLKAKFDELQKTISSQKSEYEKQIKTLELETVLKAKADEFKCKDYDLAKSQIDIDALLESKNQSADIDKAFNAIKESKPILFEEEKQDNGKVVNIIAKTSTGVKGLTKEQFNKMSYKERVELKQNNEELYNQMTESEE